MDAPGQHASSRGGLHRVATLVAAPAVAAAVAVLLAAAFLDERLFLCAWAGVATALLLVGRIRGWWGELWTLVAAALGLAIAFHWAPKVLAYSMNSDEAVGFAFTVPIVLWDALRLAAPFWFAARVTDRPATAWLAAGAMAAGLEAVLPGVFPWKLGYAQLGWPVLVQSVDLLGPEFSTFMLFAAAGAVACLCRAAWGLVRGACPAGGSRWPAIRAELAAGAPAFALCGLNLIYGFVALARWERAAAEAPSFTMALVQANPADADGLEALRSLTAERCSGAEPPPDVVCWPECSGGSYEAGLESLADPEVVLRCSRQPNPGLVPLDDPECPLLFGGQTYAGHPEKPRFLHQSAILVDERQAIRGRYHKRHLMPFGEYVPLTWLYPDMKLYFPMADEYTEGGEPAVLDCGDRVRMGVMLCYEDMVPDAAASLARRSANVLVSLINGSAFTEPLTLRQHRLLAQARAIECRRALVRCAATGETCVIAPTGVVVAALPLHDRAVLDARVPLLESATLFTRTGRLFPAACGLGVALVGWRAWRRRRGEG